MYRISIYLNLICFLLVNQFDSIKTEKNDQSLKQSNKEVTSYNEFLNYLFGTQYSKAEQDLLNSTHNNLTIAENNTKKFDFICNPRNLTSNQTIHVKLITPSTKSYVSSLSESNIEMLRKNNECILLLLYFGWCPHSIRIAPFFNAIGRSYPQLHVMAINSYNHNGINLRLSLFGVPSIILLQHDRVVARFNETEINLTTLKEFISKTTFFEPIHELELIYEDFEGPVPTRIEEQFDYIMFSCIVFLIFTFCYFARMTGAYEYLIETIRSTWLESQREHLD